MTCTDNTFVSFTREKAAVYAANRGSSYPSELYQAILEYHHGERNLVLDVGSGPGNAVFGLLPFFKCGIGSDPSVQMIEQAKKEAEKRGVSDRTKFVVCAGEECANVLSGAELGTVDMLTVAMAAHWMHMRPFYVSAAKALRPGGTLAMWTASSYYCHPSTPNARAVQEALDDLENNMLASYMAPGNWISKNAYETLSLPWENGATCAFFEQSAFVRRHWDRNGVPSAPAQADGTPGAFLAGGDTPIETIGKFFGSASPVIRWREANPLRAHTDEDPVNITMRRLQEALGDVSSIRGAPSYSLLLMRRS
ncbi:S-adenosyl-L-methionine-dependent methyltransferase [Mycena pura]|uniref:S-adenosyl-L-methionine-dependent methyltransferase n=1 Tax=Mycena pura TaxID=153505 RepID=A0AAD6YK40_9AGAR|nr:S-adenosyl-L-methionine-dependent methyltransferase [Mycena pura]